MQLSNRTVLITGGSAGVGLELARAFKKLNNRVIICARDAKELQAASLDVGDIETIQTDLSQENELITLAETVKAQNISILINNAGIQFNNDFTQLNYKSALKEIDAEIDLNFKALVKLTALILPQLLLHSQSAIVNISSGLAIAPKKTAPVYCATKAAVSNFSRALRYQMEDSGSNVAIFNVILPLVATRMTEGRGTGKISPQQAAREICEGMRRDRSEIYVAKAKLLGLMHRLLPQLAYKILRNG